MKKITAPVRACTLLIALALALSISYFQHTATSIVTAQSVTPAALNELSIDDGSSECILGSSPALKGKPGFGWVNQLTPASYPATLRSITIGFNRSVIGREVKRDAPYRIAVYLDPEKDGPGDNQQPDASFIGRVRGDFESIMTFSLVTPLTIQSGSFVVGAIDEFGITDFAALYDVPGKSNPAGTESFVTFNSGGLWAKFSDLMFAGTSFCEHPGSFIIRATIETGAVDGVTVTKIQDPLAVEPWSVLATFQTTFVTNLVSDNMTVIKTIDGTFQNVAVGDGPGGVPDGPFGIAPLFPAGKLFVTLFGSNTVPSKEFPIDYSTVEEGKVAVMTIGANGALTQALTVNVGKGPRFPAMVPINGGKIYVPCGGANRVDVISGVTNQKIAEIPVGLDPSSCTVSINNSKVYVTNFGDGSISVIDPKTDQKIKDIPAPHVILPTPVGATEPPAAPLLKNPWQGAVSSTNGNLYVTYWGTEGDVFPNGAIAEFDTCRDEFVRATLDDTTRGSASGSAGATGIAAPDAPLALDPMTGTTPGAGGGGGGPFGIAQCDNNLLAFTNDARGIAGLLDTRIDQVVSAPPFALASCPKPRGISCAPDPNQDLPPTVGQQIRLAYVACGQPDNSVIIFNVPRFTQNIAGLPVVESIEVGGKVKIKGEGFTPAIRLEVIAPGTLTCLTFDKDFKIKKSGKLIEQKGKLSNGQKLRDIPGAFLRLTHVDGTVLIFPISG
jgi:YVTN family beta-propeller protein